MIRFKKLYRIVLLAILLQGSSSCILAGDSILLEKVEGEGLTNYYIKCIQQDKYGFLWFGTEEGLFRYDGYSFVRIRHYPAGPGSLPDNNMEFLRAEEDGKIWVGSRGGLSSVDCKTLQVRNYPGPRRFTVYSLLPLGDTAMMVATSNGLYSFTRVSGAWHRIAALPEDLMIRSLAKGQNDDLYIASHKGFYILKLRSGALRHFDIPVLYGSYNSYGPTQQICHRVIIDRHGDAWFSTWNTGLIKYEPSTDKMTVVLPDSTAHIIGPLVTTYDILQENDGKIIAANSENGITLFDPKKHHSCTTPVNWDAPGQIPARVYSLYRDRSGILWVGTENGVYKSDPNLTSFRTIEFRQEKSAPAMRPDLAPLCQLTDKQGLLWIGTYDGLYLVDRTTGFITDYSAQTGIPKYNMINTLCEDQAGDIWGCTRRRLVRLHKTISQGKVQLHPDVFSTPSIQTMITTMCIDHENKFWLGTYSNGLFRFDPTTGIFTRMAPVDTSIYRSNQIFTLLETADGDILMGGEHTGLLKITPSTGAWERIDSFNKAAGPGTTIRALTLDSATGLWIGTEENGLWQADPKWLRLKQYTLNDGLPSMNVFAVVPTQGEHIWLLTEAGVVDFRQHRKKMVVLNRQAGIRNFYDLFSLYKMGDGSVAIGDMRCIHIFNDAQAARNLPPPVIIITGFRVMDQEYFPDSTALPSLSYDQNYFSFEYVALNYTRTPLNRYAYMLDGIDRKWNEVGGQRYASYANLREGTYTFKVKACNSDGVWNEFPATLTFIIRPPFWRTWWFYLLVAILAAGAIGAIYYFKIDKIKAREALRNRIARDLHDDLGSTLSGINIFSRIALEKLSKEPKASEELMRRINQRSAKSMEALSDIVWSINSRGDDIMNLVTRMQEYLGELLEPLGIQYQLDIDLRIRHLPIDMETRRDIYLIFKEAVCNASKYSQCTLIKVSVTKEKGHTVAMLIEDNGIGFDVYASSSGNGISNMQERAAGIGAIWSIQSQPGNGTTVQLQLRVT